MKPSISILVVAACSLEHVLAWSSTSYGVGAVGTPEINRSTCINADDQAEKSMACLNLVHTDVPVQPSPGLCPAPRDHEEVISTCSGLTFALQGAISSGDASVSTVCACAIMLTSCGALCRL